MMTENHGWSIRANLLRGDVERALIEPLATHGWKASVERVECVGEYAVVSAERNGLRRTVALLYSSATANAIYRRLEGEVDLTLFNGAPYELEAFTRGLSRPVHPVGDFQHHLNEWNRDSEPGRLAQDVPSAAATDKVDSHQPRSRRLLSETPIEAVWLRLARLKSATLARRMVTERAAETEIGMLADIAASKGDGVAYAVRNAADYFSLDHAGNLSRRVLNLYYGCLSFVLAEMLAAPAGPSRLEQVEDITKQGHGLWNLDQDGNLSIFAIGPLQSGLFPAWMKAAGCGPLPMVAKKPRAPADLNGLPTNTWVTVEQLFARIPEVGDLFEDIFTSAPAWMTPAHDPQANNVPGMLRSSARLDTSYIWLIDDTGRMKPEDVAQLPGPLREIRAVPSGTRSGKFRAAVDHPGLETWWEALNVHHSPFERNALILPMFGSVDQYRIICIALLYALSIVVRYRPSLWRRVQEGDLVLQPGFTGAPLCSPVPVCALGALLVASSPG